MERFGDGTLRWRVEPKLSFGVLPFTEIELRVPVLRVLPRAPAATTTGVASLAFGALHAFNLETTFIPAVAIAGEIVLPVGSLASPRGMYAFKGVMTKTLPWLRVQLNVSGGSWNVRPTPTVQPGTCGTGQPGVPPCNFPPAPPDVPCDVAPAFPPVRSPISGDLLFGRCAASITAPAAGAVLIPRTSGMRWMGGVGVDRALPLRSLLIAANVVVERYYGLYAESDWTAEVGVRRQMTPQLVFDVGVGRRFHGATQATSVMLGFTYGIPTTFLGKTGGDS